MTYSLTHFVICDLLFGLQRAVMEAAMNLLGGGLRVRVLLQGKKVPDEAVTLLQLGISHNTKPESLDFMLEPSPLPTSSSATAEDPLLVLSHAASPPVPRSANHCSCVVFFNLVIHCLIVSSLLLFLLMFFCL